MNNIQPDVARAFLRQLSGFRGYPKPSRLPDGTLDFCGEGRFVDCLCEISLSVEHALAIVESFDGEFPTIREMRDTALNLRPKFEPKVDQRAEWDKQYGKPDLSWSAGFAARAAGAVPAVDPTQRKRLAAEEFRAMLWQAVRDSLYYTEGPGGGRFDAFWQDAADQHKRTHPAEVVAFRVQLAESGWDKLMAVDWLKAMPAIPRVPSVLGPITQADVKRELAAQGREAGDGE